MTVSDNAVANRLARFKTWLAVTNDETHPQPPFSFSFGGRQLQNLLGELVHETSVGPPDASGRTHQTVTYHDRPTGLAARCETVQYGDFLAVEWTPYLRNEGTTDLPILADIQALDFVFERQGDPEFVLHHATGSPALATDYEPRQTRLRPRSENRITTKGGRPSDTDLPYFNLEFDGGGVIIAIGWPGQWAVRFDRDERRSVRIRGGQEQTHFTLHPNEEVRGPLIAILAYEGDWIDGQNSWRRWMIAHNLPKINGEPPVPFISAGSSNQTNEMDDANEENQKLFIDRYLEKKIPLDYYWMDAGWYVTASGHWYDTGTWEVDRKRFPGGLRAVIDHAHQNGLKCVVWFEPERLVAGSWLAVNHPEWLVTLPGYRWTLLDLGNPEAWRWVVEHFDALIRAEGVDLYRQDFNVAPLDYWRSQDAPDRQGITEIRHITGYLRYWDELRRRHPDMLLDTCASGGRRLDLETLRRSVPLHKSDHDYRDHTARQSQAYGIAFWMPFHGAPVCRIDRVDTYAVRSAVGTMLGLGYDVRSDDLDYPLLRKLTLEWKANVDYYFGDYYPLTPYSADGGSWLAWQYHRPDQGDGLIQVFRRATSPFLSAQFKLRGLEPDATYVLTDVDRGEIARKTGQDLATNGFVLTIEEQPSAVSMTYRKG